MGRSLEAQIQELERRNWKGEEQLLPAHIHVDCDMPAFFAICSAFLYALSSVIVRIGLRYAGSLTAVLVSLLAGIAVSFFLCALVGNLEQLMNRAVLFFMVAGIVGPFWGRFFFYKGVERIGISIASPIYETKPLLPVIAGISILGEELTASITFGILLMMAGAGLVGLGSSGGQIQKSWSRRDLIFPIAAGVCYGISHVLRKMGIDEMPNPMVGVLMQNLGALAFIFLLLFTRQISPSVLKSNGKAWALFSLSGVIQIVAQWSLFVALDAGELVWVSPLTSLSSFFVLVLTALFLRGLEKVTLKIALGAGLIVGATLLLAKF